MKTLQCNEIQGIDPQESPEPLQIAGYAEKNNYSINEYENYTDLGVLTNIKGCFKKAL